jgi:hypothetical protein
VRRPDGRAREGKEGKDYPPGGEPNQTSRATLLVPGPALRRFGSAEAWTSDERALSASARTRVFHRDGRGRRQDAGRRALVAPETGRRRTLRHRLARTGSAPRQLFGQPRGRPSSHRLRVSRKPSPVRASPKADAAPLTNASGSAPRGRDGHRSRTLFHSFKDYFQEESRTRTPSITNWTASAARMTPRSRVSTAWPVTPRRRAIGSAAAKTGGTRTSPRRRAPTGGRARAGCPRPGRRAGSSP